jgi:amino acid transporter
VFGGVSPRRQTPIAAIVFTTLIAAALVLTGNLDALANTTVVLLLVVFTIVNVAVLVLRRDPVAHDHFVAPTFIPALGALVSAGMVTQHTAGIYARAGILLVIGVVLWFVNRAVGGGTGDELNVEKLAE